MVTLFGRSGRIIQNGKSISIGQWRIYHSLNQAGMEKWSGIVKGKEPGIHGGNAEGIFESSDKVYDGEIVIFHVSIPSMIFNFKGNNELSEQNK